MGPAGIPDLVTADSDPEDWLWKTVRKGVAPAFAAQAMRSVTAACISTPLLAASLDWDLFGLQCIYHIGIKTKPLPHIYTACLWAGQHSHCSKPKTSIK